MGLHIFAWLLLIPSALTFGQNRYTVVYEKAEVVSFNSSYLGFVKTHNFKHNRTTAVTILTADVKVAFENEPIVEVQAYRSASNEYREFPLRFMFDFCEYCAKKELGLETIFACGNSTGCPFKKGLYTSCAWAPNSQKFPPNVPAGNYMLELKFFFRSKEFLFLQMYLSMKYPEV